MYCNTAVSEHMSFEHEDIVYKASMERTMILVVVDAFMRSLWSRHQAWIAHYVTHSSCNHKFTLSTYHEPYTRSHAQHCVSRS